ncbi:MAG TPA: wax ester/triacylglycerol synthase family O-acyltransferase [Thermoleophilaceae bacterium]|nr:wax ester/triacylglycerol synthase family O-acyltransferase [Thermoleophilaceae bacterium]
MSDRLGSLDAAFLELEDAQEAAHMHIGAVMVFEGRPGGPPSLTRLREEIEHRMHLLPRYAARLSSAHVPPLRRPTWEPDPSFAVAEHVRRAGLPAPGGERELMDWCGEYWSMRLDRSRPLWELVLLEGLEGGRWALATKTHHAMVDGVASVGATQVLLDRSRAGSHMPPTSAPPPGERAAGQRLARRLGDLLTNGAELATHPAKLLSEAKSAAELVLREELAPAPASSLNVPIGPHRRYAVARARLSDFKAIKNALGGTVNDVVLAVVAGGLRRLLSQRGDALPEHGLRAMVPVSLRVGEDEGELGNRVSSLFVNLPVCEPEPLRRYLVTAGETAELKAEGQARGGAELLALAGLAPPLLHSVLARSTTAARLFNLTVTNVPGPPKPLYAFGSKLEEVLPLVPLAADHAVGVAVVSYNGHMFFGLSGDERAVPDLDVLSKGIQESIAELRAEARQACA